MNLIFSILKIDLSIRFAILTKMSWSLFNLLSYLSWIIIGLLFLITGIVGLYFLISRYHRPGIKTKRKVNIFFLSLFILSLGWHLFPYKGILTDFYPQIVYDNEVGRTVRFFEGFLVRNKRFFVPEKDNLSGKWERYEEKNKEGIHVVYAILDTLQYEFLSFHGNPWVPHNLYLEKMIRDGKLIDFGVVLSCGSYTQASLPNMLSMNNCKIGPVFNSELLTHLTRRIGIRNYTLNYNSLNDYYHVLFEKYVEKPYLQHIDPIKIGRALNFVAEDLKKQDFYPQDISTLTMVYHNSVHPGILCKTLIYGGYQPSACLEEERFASGENPLYPYAIALATRIYEKDLEHFIQKVEDDKKPILLLLSADHGLGKNFFHGDIADSEISPDDMNKAVQRHTNVLVYANKSYRNLFPEKWRAIRHNAKTLFGRLNHNILVPSLLGALALKWDKGEEIINKWSIFSNKIKPILPKEVKPDLQYLFENEAMKKAIKVPLSDEVDGEKN